MSRIKWDDSMAVGEHIIDKRHKELLNLINDIADASDRNATTSEISRLVRRFYDFTMTHFREEEALMDHETYPQYFQQVKEHLDCSLKAIEFHGQLVNDKDFDIREMLDYLSKWFVDHTTGIDQTLVEYLKSCKKRRVKKR